MPEIKIKCPRYDGVYCSLDGRVFQSGKHWKWAWERPVSQDKDGYERVWIKMGSGHRNKKYIQVHRIVAMTFHGVPEDGLMVNHKNGVRSDNRPQNLEWVTASENMIHSKRVLGNVCLGEKASQSKIKESDVREIRDLVGSGLTLAQIGERYGIQGSQVRRIARRINWAHVK